MPSLVVIGSAGAMSRSPQLGYNHNIPHRGRLYHVQTEDSGVSKAHIFTHVFYDGTIISSNKITYDPEAQVEDLDQHIIGLMQESHKSMIRQLRRGAYDDKIVARLGEHPEGPADAVARSEAAPKDTTTSEDKRPERRAVPEPHDVERQGPPLTPGHPGPTVDPTLTHPVFSSREAQAQVAAGASGGAQRPSRGPSRVRRRAVGGIGGRGIAADQAKLKVNERRDVIIGKFASEHQAQLDEEILALLRED